MASSERSLKSLIAEFAELGVVRVLVKELAPNDNSKNQIYIGRGFETLNLIPVKNVAPKEPRKNEKPVNFKAKLDWTWLSVRKRFVAPRAQLILYPAYPEVRISGFLDECDLDEPTSALMSARTAGRVLFIGVADRTKIYAHAAGRGSRVVSDWKLLKKNTSDWRIDWHDVRSWKLNEVPLLEGPGGFFRFELIDKKLTAGCIRAVLKKLQCIHRAGWHDAKRLEPSGQTVVARGKNAGGNTLECLFGIPSNPSKEPDYQGWELKNLDAQSDRLTLTTPEPKSGYYKEQGVVAFVEKFGYPDEKKKNRRNFASPHLFSQLNEKTKLTLSVDGYSVRKKKITNHDGGIVLKTRRGTIAAKWNFSDLMFDWNRKHSRVVVVPSSSALFDGRKYNFLQNVAIAERSDFLRFLQSLTTKKVYFDPGTNVIYSRGRRAKPHRRNQFRAKPKDLDKLYRVFRWVNICDPIVSRSRKRKRK
jgi:hypothetical protein